MIFYGMHGETKNEGLFDSFCYFRIHQQQVEAWQEEIKELRLLDGANEEGVQRLQNAIYLLHTFKGQ